MAMAQIIDPLPNNHKLGILCCYVNATSQIQVVRITNIANWYFERVVFPGQRLVFEALSEALLEIHTGMMASAILSDTIPCVRLSIGEDEDEHIEEEAFVATVKADEAVSAIPKTSNVDVMSFKLALASAMS